jgi:hypothetical protein
MKDDPLLWVLLSLREDHLGALTPFAHLLSDKLRTRFSMQRLDLKTAVAAIEQTAAAGGRPFALGVAGQLVDNLTRIRVQGHAIEIAPGQFVELLQLQVVCYRLWENLKDRPPSTITAADVAQLGDVNQALAQFYDQIVAQTLAQTGVAEIDLRDWFEQYLITESETRGLVFRGRTRTGGLANQAIDFLTGRFLLRATFRAGGIWYELIHDRLIEPILHANEVWRLKHPLIQIARTWAETDQNPGRLLLNTQQLKTIPIASWTGLGPQVRAYLETSRSAEAQRLQEQGQASNLHRLKITGDLTLISPVSPNHHVTLIPTPFRWSWDGPLTANDGFEVRIWAEGENPIRAHSTIADNQQGRIQCMDKDIYSLTVDLHRIPDLAQSEAGLWWSVGLVRVKPTYVDLGRQAEPAALSLDPDTLAAD